MKVKLSRRYLIIFVSLYPTWFRWKRSPDITESAIPTTLYPTWFRWKGEKELLDALEKILYIPHGSDERLRSFKSHQAFSSLYPTWFRWKRLRHLVRNSASVLYIPHGSDERAFFLGRKKGVLHFISHMVQMKAVIAAAMPRSVRPTFISHMVQMKGYSSAWYFS